MATTTPINNTPKAEAPQLSKTAAVVDKKPSGPVDTLEVAKSDAKSSETKSKSWFSSCWETILNWFKCIFCCGCSKKEESASTTNASSTKATTSATNATSKTKIDEKAEVEKLKGLEREIYAWKWMKKAAFEKGDEADFLKAVSYVNFLTTDETYGSIKEFKENYTTERVDDKIKVCQGFQTFAQAVLSEKTTNEDVMKAWKEVDRYYFNENILKHAQNWRVDSSDDASTRSAINDYVLCNLKHREEVDKKCEEHLKKPLMKKACQRILDLGVFKAGQED